MIDETLLTRLMAIGMSEYEAKVFAILTALRIASGREIHEQTKIPRGRVYETLASLQRKSFVHSSGNAPVRYAPADLAQTFERLKRDSVRSLDELHGELRILETETPEPVLAGYEMNTAWTRDNQIRMMLRRAKNELVVLCNDAGILARYSADIARAAQRVTVWFVAGSPEIARDAPVKCYEGGSDIAAALFGPDGAENTGPSRKLVLIADRRESIAIMEEHGRLTGIFICPHIFAGYMARKIIQEIRPVGRKRREH